jgi:hypothetical protein
VSANKFKPHVHVLPEDDANRQLANGFVDHIAVAPRSVTVLPPAGGWTAVRDSFPHGHNEAMRRFPDRLMVLLVDFDGRGLQRLRDVTSRVDPAIADRVFVLGAEDEPGKLRAQLREKYEPIGRRLAEECARRTDTLWTNPLLVHNAPEVARLLVQVRPLLFL